MKKLLAVLLVVLLLLPAAAAEDAQQYIDVHPTDWFAADVQFVSELGLMKGVGVKNFGPGYPLSVAEGLAIACRLHSIYTGNNYAFTQGTPWFQVYVDYAVANKILTPGLLEPARTITREQFAYLICGALPLEELPAINEVGELPDVQENSTFGGFVYRLYRAGIMTGSDKYGTCKPQTAIRRCEIATILTRVADKSRRKTFTLETNPVVVTDVRLHGRTLLTVGETVQLEAAVYPADARDPYLYWAAGNPAVATVDQNGVVTARKTGKCNISVTSKNGVQKVLTLTVVDSFSPESVYERLIAVKSYLPDGMPWGDANSYRLGSTVGKGCVAFAFELTDAAFGKLPLRTLQRGRFIYEDLRVGDMPRVNNDTHTVVILEIHPDCVVVAEGNYNRSVRWGRRISRQEIIRADYVWTRYPD